MNVMAEALIALETGSTEGADRLPSLKLVSRARTLADWASEFTKFLERGMTSTLDLAKTVYLAKTSLRYGQWSKLWECDCRIPFSKSTADMLAKIGHEFGDLDSQTFANLPAGWSILHQLARLRRLDLQTLINEGKIHPALTLAEAKSLVARFNGQPGAKSHRSNAKTRFRHFQDFVHETSMNWSASERDFVRAELFQLALELKELRGPLPSVNRLFPDRSSLPTGSTNN